MNYSQAAIDRAKLLRAKEKMPGATQSALDFALDDLSYYRYYGLPQFQCREVIHILSEKNQEVNLWATNLANGPSIIPIKPDGIG